MSEMRVILKVGSKGEIYPPKKLRDSVKLSPGDLIEVLVVKEGEMRIRKIPKVEELITRAARKRNPIQVEDLEKELEQLQAAQVNASLADMKDKTSLDEMRHEQPSSEKKGGD